MCKRFYCLLFISISLLLIACGEGRPNTSTKTVNELPVPENFIVRQQNQSNVLSWKEVENTTYTIYWSTEPDVSTKGSQRLDEASSPYTHNNLINGTTYYYVIKASQESKTSPYSSAMFATPSSFSALSKPENFRLSTNNGRIILSWNKVSGAERYKIYWTTDADENPLFSGNTPFETNVNSFAHRDVQIETKYYYVVTALAFDGESEPTEKKWIAVGFLLPEIPSNLEIHEIDVNSVSIVWDSAKNATEYKVYWSTIGPDFELSTAKSGEVKAGENIFLFLGLQRGTIYYLKVVGINSGGVGLPSAALKIDFSDDPGNIDRSLIPPNNIEFIVRDITAELKWETGNVRYSYRVYFATEPGVRKDNFLTLENGSSSRIAISPRYNLDNLLIGRKYYLVVVALLGDKQSAESEEISFTVNIPDATFEKSSVDRGAYLYSQWWRGFAATPTTENPIWQDALKDAQGNPINQSETEDTWKCSECHGWDYQGKDGEFGVGSEHYTGFPGLSDVAKNKTKEEIFSFILNGKTSNNRSHNFEKIFRQDALDLTRFILSEASNKIDVWAGNPSIGQTVYTQKNVLGNACQDSGCHADFPSENIEKKILLDSALAEPARFIHYTRFGVGIMPGGQSVESAKHVLAFLWQDSLDNSTSNFQQTVFDKTGADFYNQWAQGGLLYDRWWKAIAVEKNPQPLGNHLLWPSNDTVVNGQDTWRCKECHGWDYQGKNGTYGKGKHFTGISGVIGSSVTKKTAQEIYDFLRMGDQHAYSRFLSDEDIYALTRFVLEIRKEKDIQQSPDDLIDKIKKEPVSFNETLGESLYNDSITFGGCITCHIVDDFQWFFNDADPERKALQTLDSIAKTNPWEFMHKVRFGQPGSNMNGIIQLESTSPEAAINVLGHVQTTLAPNVKRGGRLYDNWWLENGLSKPVSAHSLWPSSTMGIRAEETWRCVNCHGWDYKGQEGIKGVLNITRNTQSFITSGTYLNTSDHSFVKELKREDIHDLTAFIMSSDRTGVRNDIDMLISNADLNAGKTQYISTTPGNCINCHGVSGTSIPNIDLETAAKSFSTRFIHKARFGSPASIMLPSLNRFKGLTAVQAADVHAYASLIRQSTPSDSGLDRGGRLFDNWFKEMKAADPTVQTPVLVNPLWESRKVGIPDVQSLSDSWRCVTCHNWNYKGIDLISVDTDADNLLQKLALRRIEYPNQTDLADYFYEWIKNGSSNLHNYGNTVSGLPSVLGDRELKELALFITQGVIETSEYIYNIDGKVINGDVNSGKKLYTGQLIPEVNCASCHGDSGESIPPGGSVSIDIFAIAEANPWQFLHKVRFASSGTEMPSLVGLPGTNLQQAIDVLSYAQAEFTKRP